MKWVYGLALGLVAVTVGDLVDASGSLHGIIPRSSAAYAVFILITLYDFVRSPDDRPLGWLLLLGLTVGWFASWAVRDSGSGWLLVIAGGALAYGLNALVTRAKRDSAQERH